MFSISIALVTRNRPESLERTLVSLLKQDIRPLEVIISDDSDDNNIVRTTKALAHKYGCIYVSGPQKGLYANRNFAAHHCRGTHLRTMDDDHTFPENHLKECLRAIYTDSNAIWTIGEYYPNDNDKKLPGPIPGQLHPRGFSYKPINMQEYYGISCGATIYPRKVIDENILNLENYQSGILYLEYGARLKNNGFRLKHLSNTYVVHYVDDNDSSIANPQSSSQRQVLNEARVFSMLMFSFFHRTSLKNKILTALQITKDLITLKYSLRLVLDAYQKFTHSVRLLS